MRLPYLAYVATAVLLLLPAAKSPAQQEEPMAPHLPPGSPTHLPPGPAGNLPNGPMSVVGSAQYLVTSAANDHGAYLWIVGPSQQIVILCQKAESDHDFSCRTKRLP